MMTFTVGDILQCEAEALVNTVNCVGIMGRGVALQFKKAFPDNFRAYAAACKHGEVEPGRLFVFDTGSFVGPRYIINFPTKRHWRSKSRINDISDGLTALVQTVQERGIASIAIPPLGSGLGGLDWRQVRALIESALAELATSVEVIVYEPGKVRSTTSAAAAPRMTVGRAVLVELIQRYLAGLLDPFVTLLEVHKLMYFMQEAGEPLRLRYKKAHYGPYADNLRHVLTAVEGHMVTGYIDGGDAPGKEIALVEGVAEQAQQLLADDANADTRRRFERVVDLIDGFESPSGLELLSSVHWIAQHESPLDRQDLVAKIRGWNPRKQMFTPRQIGIAADTLESKGWVTSHRD